MGLAVYNYILTPFLTFQPWPALGYSFLPDPSFPARACDYAGFAHAIEKGMEPRLSPARLPITDISQWVERYSLMATTLALRFPEKAPEPDHDGSSQVQLRPGALGFIRPPIS